MPIKLINPGTDISTIENQLRSIGFVDWQGEFTEEVMNNTSQFWSNVYNWKSGGLYKYRELAAFALKVLCLPLSNAVLERVFSVINSIKTKFRNKMQVAMLTSILRIRMHFYATQKCCKSFEPSAEMFVLFNASMYDTPSINVNETPSGEVDYLTETLTLFPSAEGDDECC